MDVSSLPCSLIPSPYSSGELLHQGTRLRLRRKRLIRVQANRRNEDINGQSDSNSKMVDANIPTLRRRIREIKGMDVADGLYKQCMEIEKDLCYKIYESEMWEIFGFLQLQMMEPEKRMSVGLTLMLKLSIPTSVLVVLLQLMDAAKFTLDAMQAK